MRASPTFLAIQDGYIYNAPQFKRNCIQRSTSFKMTEVVDRTNAVYGDAPPASVQEGKRHVLSLLKDPVRAELVKKVEFMENFGLNNSETARAGEPRYTGLVVSLSPEFQLHPDGRDAAWLNGLYAESVQMFPTETNGEVENFVSLQSNHMKPGDSHGVAGIYQLNSQDDLTGEVETRNYVIVNTSAGDQSRELVNGWTSTGMSIKDCYESAATEKYMGVKPSGAADVSETSVHDNLKAFTEAKIAKLSKKFTPFDAQSPPQTSNVFLRGNDCLHYLNGAIAAGRENGALCLVSPLHGYVRFLKTADRHFFPSTLLSSDRYVDVSKLNGKQQRSIFERAVWPSHTTCNAFALRKPIQNWTSALPQPKDVYRMAKSNFSLDTEVHRCLPTAAVLAMTPLRSSDASTRFPAHVKEGKIQVADTDRLCAQLLSLRRKLKTHILNPAFYNEDKPGVLELPRDIAESLVAM